MLLGFRSVGFFLFRGDEVFPSGCNSLLVLEPGTRGAVGKCRQAPLRHPQCGNCQVWRNFTASFLLGWPFSDTSRACLVAMQKTASVHVNSGVWGCKESPSCNSCLGSCKEASMPMAMFIQKLTSHPIKHHAEPEGQVLMSLCLELNCWHFMRALSLWPEGPTHLIRISTKETLLMRPRGLVLVATGCSSLWWSFLVMAIPVRKERDLEKR